ncbi:MAG: 50S ribosomal protein L7ae-like protein [Clostridia bacterium]|nr:50S ribosomal protein L7ae-like protein [Clostridia bacterium]
MEMDALKNIPKVIGAKQTAKALQKEQVKVLYIAKDAETKVIDPLEQEAKSRGVQIVRVPTMKELGRAFGIEVGAAAAAILKQ